MANRVTEPLYARGDYVRVRYMDDEVTGEVVVVERLKHRGRPSGRVFYKLAIPGVLGHPAYEEHEIHGRADGD